MRTLRKDREGFAELLPGAQYFPLDPVSKRPLVKLKDRQHQRTPPSGAQYGLLIPNRMLVVDVDTHTDDQIDPQVSAMSHLLGVDLTETLTVETASGGRHFYLWVPEGVDLGAMPNGSLRHLDYLLREEAGVGELLNGRPLDTDFKLGKTGSISYTVGAGSQSLTGSYRWLENPILTISTEAAQAFIDIRSTHKQRKVDERRARARGNGRAIRNKTEVEVDLKDGLGALSEIHPARFANLKSSLLASTEAQALRGQKASFHSQRAHVFQLMNCCFTPSVIARACMALGIDRDTYTESRIDYADLIADVQNLRETFPEASFHGVVCGKGKYNAAAVASGTLEENLSKLAERVESRSLARRAMRVSASARATVVNTELAGEALAKIARPSSAGFANADRILVDLVQPLLNAGADRVIMSRKFLCEEFELTDSQAAKALSALRRAGILEVRDRQRTGVAPTYCINRDYVDVAMSEMLTLERQLRQLGEDVFPALIMDYKTSSITEAYTGDVISGDASASPTALAVTQRYCRDEADRREAIASEEYSIEDWELGLDELDNPASLIKSPIRELYSNPERLEDLESSQREHVLAQIDPKMHRGPAFALSHRGVYGAFRRPHSKMASQESNTRDQPVLVGFADGRQEPPNQPRDRLLLEMT